MAAGFPGKIKERETGFEFGNAKKHRKDAGVNLLPSVVTHLVTHMRNPLFNRFRFFGIISVIILIKSYDIFSKINFSFQSHQH